MPNTTEIGYENSNGQVVVARTDLKGSDHNQKIYILACTNENCGHLYGAKGSDIHRRRCPACQGGEPGEKYKGNV